MICSNRLPLMVVDALRTGLHAAAPMRPANSHVKAPCDTVQSTVSVTTLVNGYPFARPCFNSLMSRLYASMTRYMCRVWPWGSRS